jgi:hypothetical protein
MHSYGRDYTETIECLGVSSSVCNGAHRVVSGNFPRHLDKTSDAFVLNIIMSDGAVQGA